MVMGERRSRQKNTVTQKDMSTHLSIFHILQTIDFYRLEGVHQCSLPPRPCGRRQARANRMVMGERRSCKKTTAAQKDMSTHLSIFTFYKQLISTGWRVRINVPWPGDLVDAARHGLTQCKNFQYVAMRPFLYLKVCTADQPKKHAINCRSHNPHQSLHIHLRRRTSQGLPTLPGSPPRPPSLQQGRAKR